MITYQQNEGGGGGRQQFDVSSQNGGREQSNFNIFNGGTQGKRRYNESRGGPIIPPEEIAKDNTTRNAQSKDYFRES